MFIGRTWGLQSTLYTTFCWGGQRFSLLFDCHVFKIVAVVGFIAVVVDDDKSVVVTTIVLSK